MVSTCVSLLNTDWLGSTGIPCESDVETKFEVELGRGDDWREDSGIVLKIVYEVNPNGGAELGVATVDWTGDVGVAR